MRSVPGHIRSATQAQRFPVTAVSPANRISTAWLVHLRRAMAVGRTGIVPATDGLRWGHSPGGDGHRDISVDLDRTRRFLRCEWFSLASIRRRLGSPGSISGQ